MKKRKIYEISVIDRTYSKTISDETKFYTSDTALELGFELKETEYDFESAEIVLLNIDDRSLVTRLVAKSLDSFTYELEDDIIAHYGEWRGQLRFEQNGETYVSSPVKFRIENDLSNDRPPQLSDVQSWVSLKRYADSLTEELKQAVLSVEGIENTFNQNELERQTTFETAEQSRQSAELIRVSAEAQRKIDHANRSSELAGKANKKQEEWIAPTLLNGWTNRVSSTPVRFRKNEFGRVEIEGAIKGGTLGVPAFVLPQGYGAGLYYPKVFGALNYGGLLAEVAISGNNFTIVKSSTTVWISLEGISYEPN